MEPLLPGGTRVLHEASKKQVEGETWIPSKIEGATPPPGGINPVSGSEEGLTSQHYWMRIP